MLNQGNVTLNNEEIECTECGAKDLFCNWHKVLNEKNEVIHSCCPKCQVVGKSRFTLKTPCKQCVKTTRELNAILPPCNQSPYHPETPIIERVEKEIKSLQEKNKLLELTLEKRLDEYERFYRYCTTVHWGYSSPTQEAPEGCRFDVFDTAPRATFHMFKDGWLRTS